MNIYDLRTPVFLLDYEKLLENINDIQVKTNESEKLLYPMTKTHKSTQIAKMQLDAGAEGLLVGTIDEALKFSDLDVNEIVIAYPILGERNLNLITELRDKVNIILSLDSIETATIYDYHFKKNGMSMDYILLINSGLNRLGVKPDRAGRLVSKINNECSNLNFKGISTHAGQVYKCKNYKEVTMVSEEEISALELAYDSVRTYGFKDFTVSTGTTPTFDLVLKSKCINIVRPGNYVYYDAIQVALGIVSEDKCALTLLSTVISNPEKGKYILDIGSKCLGLDKGAHGNDAIRGYGLVINHNAQIDSVSEEVSIMLSEEKFNIGDKVRIIPNHSCSANNMTNHLVVHKDNYVKDVWEVDVRSNSIKPKI